jgi:hypothetical protein
VGEESLDGPLTVRGALSTNGALAVRGDLSVGIASAGSAVRVLKKQEDGRAATDGALVLGTDSPASAALRVGYYSTYSWLQGQGQQAIALNPHGGNVGIGTGTAAPAARLHVGGDALVAGTLSFGNGSQINADQGGSIELGGNNDTAGTGTPYIDFHFNGKKQDYNVRLINDADGRLSLAGGSLRLDSGQEVFFTDNGQIRSLDNNHRILFRRSENKLELREWGDIVFSSGAKSGNETATAVLTAAGNLGIGVAAPVGKLQVNGDTVWSEKLGQRFILHTRQNGAGDFLQLTVDDAAGNWDWGKGITLRRSTGNVGIGNTNPEARLHVNGDALVSGSYRFGNNSQLQADQGGSIELGGNNSTAGTGVPYIDFHYRGLVQDYNTRIINDDNGRLSILAGNFAVRDCFAVSLGCADFNIGHPSRRGSPGRALVDGTSILYMNYDNDWSGGVTYWGALNRASTRDIKEDILTLDAPDAAALLRGLEPVRYRMIGDESRAEHMGFIAEDVPDAIAGPDHRTINESHIVAVLTRVVKEQQRRLDELAHRLETGLSHA